jgi:hypothetical protein
MNHSGRLKWKAAIGLAFFVTSAFAGCTDTGKGNEPGAGADGGMGGDAGFVGVDADTVEAVDAADADDADADDADADDADAGAVVFEEDKGPHCLIGEVSSVATANDLSLFGTPVYFNDGNPLPAGTYVVRYIDGCMKFNGGLDWTVNDSKESGCCHWWLIGDDLSDKKFELPGMTGYLSNGRVFATFDDCVRAGKRKATRVFDFAGGKLGIWLQDTPYNDNMVGPDGRNPKWRLVRLSDCADAGASETD